MLLSAVFLCVPTLTAEVKECLYRGYLGCGSFNSEFHGSAVTMAFGGWDGGRTIYDDSEMLVEGADSWVEGMFL